MELIRYLLPEPGIKMVTRPLHCSGPTEVDGKGNPVAYGGRSQNLPKPLSKIWFQARELHYCCSAQTIVKKFEFAIRNQGMALGTFLDIEGRSTTYLLTL